MDEHSYFEELKANVLKFLKSKGFLKELEESCKLYQLKIQANKHQNEPFPFCFTLKVNFEEYFGIKGELF